MSHGRIPMDPQMTWKLGPSAPCLFQVVPTALGQQPLPPPSKHLPPASVKSLFLSILTPVLLLLKGPL